MGASNRTGRELATRALIDDSHEQLTKSSAIAAESAFGVGFRLGLLASAVVFAVVFLATSEWSVRLIAALISVLISVVISSLLASRAKTATLQTTYGRQVGPAIQRHLKDFQMTMLEFASSAAVRLPADSPLLAFLVGEEDQGQLN
jgi:hypothetical protein